MPIGQVSHSRPSHSNLRRVKGTDYILFLKFIFFLFVLITLLYGNFLVFISPTVHAIEHIIANK